MKEAKLIWHDYKFFPYERRFGLREIEALLKPKNIKENNQEVIISDFENVNNLKKLVYFSQAKLLKENVKTFQYYLENGCSDTPRQKRQYTRYSVHGIHEYKGKFNPQVVKALFNIYNIKDGDFVLDPFCGSGTTLIEAAHCSIDARGTDINPLAVFIANAKVTALNLSANDIQNAKDTFIKEYKKIRKNLKLDFDDLRIQYLQSWFLEETLYDIEALRLSTVNQITTIQKVFQIIVSNLLREYSLQEPSDLRIRRRISPLPELPIIDAVLNSVDNFISNVTLFNSCFTPLKSGNKAYNTDIKFSNKHLAFKQEEQFDFAITSPPYATALPYIDTQRLSLVWLGLISPKEVKTLETELIGSREFIKKSEQQQWQKGMLENTNKIPIAVHSFCIELNSRLKPSEGFRKQALPSLLYRYFSDMSNAFREVHRLLKPDKYFCLIVGHNHTTIGGSRTDIDTPNLLTYIGESIGFKTHEITLLDAYQRYGLHASNAVQQESLIVFKK